MTVVSIAGEKMYRIIIIAALALTGCTGERMTGTKPIEIAPIPRDEERHKIIEQGRDFCVKYPDDIACPGKK